ncbi:MAG: hypothetical protein GY925_10415 [Actinomycetia bacterium]|nr:hypothetical protein [Actinomycetes bacterium]
MVFDADAKLKEAQLDYPPFPFKWKRKTYKLPHMGLLSANEAVALMESMNEATLAAKMAADNPDDIDQSGESFVRMLGVIDDVVGEDHADTAVVLREMPGAILGELLLAWEADSMESMGDQGKEPSEPSSPNRAARRSKPTSKPRGATSKTKTSATSAA